MSSQPSPPSLASEPLDWVARDQAQTALPEQFLPVDVALLMPGATREFDLYEQAARTVRLFCAAGYPLTRKALNALKRGERVHLLVPVSQGPALTRHVEGVLRNTLRDPTVPMERRSRILYTSGHAIMAEVMSKPQARELVKRSIHLASATSRYLLTNHEALSSMGGQFARDGQTHTHAINTCVLGMTMFKYLVSPKAKLIQRFGLGMLLMDIGKLFVGPDILNKRGRLTDAEFELMKAHPKVGCDLLHRHRLRDPVIRDAVLSHHEKLDGSGYPQGLRGRQIPPASRVAAIVDIFDALTTDRPYRRAMTTAQALDLMTTEMAPHQLDAEYLSVFSRLIVSRLHKT